MNAPMRDGEVLLVTSSFPRWAGDATTPFVHHLAQDLRALGWDVRVLAPHAPGAACNEILDGVPVHRFRYFWPESLQTVCYDGGALVKLRTNRWNYTRIPFLVLAQWLAILSRVIRRKVTLVHSHWLLPQGFTAALSAGLLGIPHVTTVHGGDVFALQGAISRICKRLVLRRADAVTVNSSATLAAVVRLTRSTRELVRIPMGASANGVGDAAGVRRIRARFRRGDGPLLVFVGRLVEEKGVGDLLDAVALLRSSRPGVSLLVVGDGPHRASLEQQAARLGIDERVEFCGWLAPDHVRQHLCAADIFVGPSRPAPDGWVEAQGLTLIEAMLAGVPVITTSIGGIADAIRDGETGLAVLPGSPRQIAHAINRLTGDPALAGRLSRAARELALREFTREVSASRFSGLYARLCDRGAVAREEKEIRE